ncbi:hypothetical protein AXG93_3582s1000 [Marchantia polymorpha subsp. ruderalis]|uniref:Uncharacterized protein n=1 Tax=Marchantia polymorpha subsp. ruderalis TaxID=1480154 RepID=A0A176W0U1_MARPO|nr:hypothetical protein AXG93_3582s1000 [Marchantia polymorpha subsp. ruderalis]
MLQRLMHEDVIGLRTTYPLSRVVCVPVEVQVASLVEMRVSEGTSGGVGAISVGISSGTVSIAGGGMSGDASGVPLFSHIPSFFNKLRKNYQGELWRGVRDAILMSNASPTLAHLFAFSEKIELNMVEERRCFDFHPELRFGGRGRGGDAPRGQTGRGGRVGRGIGAIERTVASDTSATQSAMIARIEQLQEKLVAITDLGASTSTSYEEEDFSYLASAAQVEASVVVTRGDARASKPRGAAVELDLQKG